MSTEARVLDSEQRKEIISVPGALHMSEHDLSLEDSKRIRYAYYLLGQLILDVVETASAYFGAELRRTYSRNCSPRAVHHWVRRLCREDVAEVFSDFKSALQALRHLSDNERSKYSNYKNNGLNAYVKAYGVSTGGVVWQMLQPFYSLVWTTDSHVAFELANDITQFIVRLTLSDVDWIEEENKETYVAFEEELHQLSYDPGLLQDLHDIVTEWFAEFDFSAATTDHGYGATSEVKRSAGTDEKYQKMIPTVETARLTQLVAWTPINDVWPSLAIRQRSMLERYAETGRGLHASDLVCKVQLVPKGLDKKRVVSMEPTVHQFYQKILGSAMSKHFDKHPEMRIDLHNQEYNRQLTLKGSRYRNYGTIDLSSASDSVTNTLVMAVFKDTPLFYPLQWVRTTKADLDGRIVALEKFAPMGSATCFPVECTIFSAIVSLANRRLGVNRYYRVYGDDIVCHRDVFSEVIKLLEQLHFHVNVDKSFAPELPFKESCGIEAYKGYDVSPLRLSRKFDYVKAVKTGNLLRDAGMYRIGKRNLTREERIALAQCSPQLDSLYCLANDAWKKGYYYLRKAVIKDTLGIFPVAMFSHNFEHGFFTPTSELNFRCKTVKDPNTQSLKALCFTIDSKVKAGLDDCRYSKIIEEYSYSNRTQLLTPDDRLEVATGAATTTYRWKWLPWDTLDTYYGALSTL